MQVIPTLLTTTMEEFIRQMNIFQKLYNRIQLDVGDGEKVPNVTVQIGEMIRLIEKKTVMLLPQVKFDFHLMVKDHEGELERIVKLQELGMNVNLALLNASESPNIERLNTNVSFHLGLDIFPDISIEKMLAQYDFDFIPSVQIMTVNPGFQGSPFLPEMLVKIHKLRQAGYTGEIMIDGGVNEKSIPTINSLKDKPDYVCIGSYLTKAGDTLEERVEKLKNIQ